MAKKIYLAGRLDVGEAQIGDFATGLEARGHEVIEKWFLNSALPKPYLDHPQTSSPAAARMIRAAFESDIFILFPTNDILGAAVEYGAALGSVLTNPDKRVIAVNPWEVRQSVFYAHPAVVAVKGLSQIREMDWY